MSEVIKDVGFLEIGKCYKKYQEDGNGEYLGKYKKVATNSVLQTGTQYVVFEKMNIRLSKFNENGVIEVDDKRCVITDVNELNESLNDKKCYRTAFNNSYLGEYTGVGVSQEHQGRGDLAFFKKPDGYFEFINVRDDKLLDAVILTPCEAPEVAPEPLPAPAPVPVYPQQQYHHPQQQWLNYSQLIPGRYYMDQNKIYLGKYHGYYNNAHNFERNFLSNVPWNFYFLEVSQQQQLHPRRVIIPRVPIRHEGPIDGLMRTLGFGGKRKSKKGGRKTRKSKKSRKTRKH